jgi:hypothetical protein
MQIKIFCLFHEGVYGSGGNASVLDGGTLLESHLSYYNPRERESRWAQWPIFTQCLREKCLVCAGNRNANPRSSSQ